MTRDLAFHGAAVKAPVYTYLDVVQVRPKHPLSRQELDRINDGQVGTPIFGYPFIIQHGRRQRLILCQPTEECLHSFVEREAQINRLELALDIITPFAGELKRATRAGLIQPRHGTRKITIFSFDNDNFRTADLNHRGLFFQAYDTKPSKITGKFDCFHLEAKINGVRALRQLGIDSIEDLFTFDHAQFWQRHFVVAKIDMPKLGRYHANRRDGTRRQLPLISPSGFNTDAAVGNVLFRVFGALPDQPEYTAQQFIKTYAKALGTLPYIIACTSAVVATPTILHRYGIIPAPDIRLLKPEFCYPLHRTNKPDCTRSADYSSRHEGCTT